MIDFVGMFQCSKNGGLRGSGRFCENVPKKITQKVVAQMLSLNFLVWNIIYIYIYLLGISLTICY